MKKVIIIYILMVVLMLGCKKSPLDITPDGRITMDDVFKDELLTEAYLNSTYAFIPAYFSFYEFLAFLSGATDECRDSDDGNQWSNIGARWWTGGLTPSSNPLAEYGQGNGLDHYSSFWRGIRRANVFLQNIDGVTFTSASKKNRLKGEAQLLRAFYYWELVKQYGGMPIVSVPFPNTFDYTTLKRTSFQECVDFIAKDCNEVIANTDMPMRILVGGERGRFTKAIAYAIKSEALLYNASPLWNSNNDVAKWQAAAIASKEALSSLTAGNQYMLAPNYNSYFISQSNIPATTSDLETIYEKSEGQGGPLTIINGIPSKQGTYKAGSCPTQELVDSYDMKATGEPAITGYTDADHLNPIINASSGYDPANPYEGRDPRFYATVWYNGAAYDNINGAIHNMQIYVGGTDQLLKNPPNRQNTHTGYYLRKFIDPQLPAGAEANSRWKKYRLAEIYLNYAEAENEVSGPTAEVYNAINTIRTRVSMPNLPAALTKDQMRERIRRERRVELAIEEHRFWDVRRWKILDQTDKLATGIEITKNANGTFTYERFVVQRSNAWQSKYLIFPLPIGDVSNIPDFSKNQNPGW